MKNIISLYFFMKGFIAPGVIECSPPNTNGNLLVELFFH